MHQNVDVVLTVDRNDLLTEGGRVDLSLTVFRQDDGFRAIVAGTNNRGEEARLASPTLATLAHVHGWVIPLAHRLSVALALPESSRIAIIMNRDFANALKSKAGIGKPPDRTALDRESAATIAPAAPLTGTVIVNSGLQFAPRS